MEFTYVLRFRFDATNNKAEYEALIAGLRITEQMGVKNLQANVDSRLVANQVNKTYVAKEADMVRYLEKVKALTGGFKAFIIKQIPRSETKKADALSKIASTSFAHLKEERDTWMTPIYKYLTEETLPADMKKARTIKRKSWRFKVINGIFYKKYFLGTWLRHTIRRGQILADQESAAEADLNYISMAILQIGSNFLEKLSQTTENNSEMIHSRTVIPAEIGMPTIKTAKVDLVQNDEALEINLDLLEERREEVAIHEAKSRAKMERHYNAKVRNTSFKPGDLVYNNNDASRAEDTWKLGPKWEGPYEVTEALGKGAYKFKDRNGKKLPRTWNINNLKKCYVHKM
ncbi:reverse transcriptase domain-containing protein [Tanacetum coccineum]